MRRDAPKVLFFHAGTVISDAAYDMAYTLGQNINFRNSLQIGNEGSLEPCVAVSAEEPEIVPLEYYLAYPYVTTAQALNRAARGVLTAADNPARTDIEDDAPDADPDEDEDEENEDENLTGTEYDFVPYTVDTAKSEDENKAAEEEWNKAETARIAALPDRSTLDKDHPAYKAPKTAKKKPGRGRKNAAAGGTPNAPTPPANAPAWKNNA
jgi:hypothetical protein